MGQWQGHCLIWIRPLALSCYLALQPAKACIVREKYTETAKPEALAEDKANPECLVFEGSFHLVQHSADADALLIIA